MGRATDVTPLPPRSVVAVAHVLPADVRHHLRALSEAGLLRQVFTGYAYLPDRRLERWGHRCDAVLPTNLTRLLMKRPAMAGVRSRDVVRAILPESVRFVVDSRWSNSGAPLAAADWAKRRISLAAARCVQPNDRLVLAREFEAKEAFDAAAALDIPRVYQLPIAHYHTVDYILRRELELYPDRDFQRAYERSVASRRIERKDAELALASHVLVPSLFVKDSLLQAGVHGDRIHVVPFGAEEDWIVDTLPSKDQNLCLCVGQLSIRKGVHRLLRAWKSLRAYRTCELRLIGSMRLSRTFLAEFAGMYNYVGRLPRPSLRQHYASASCLVCPSLAEGFAVVILESLSCGTPVVASRNSGAEGFIREGEEGLLHDAQDDEQLCSALEFMLSHPDCRAEMSSCCRERMRTWTWEKYRSEFVKVVLRAAGCIEDHHTCDIC